MVPGTVPCLIPANLLTQLGGVIDMRNLLAIYTEINVFQYMKRRMSGHVEVCICEFDGQWSVPATYEFLKSEVWDKGPLPTSLSSLEVTVVNGTRQVVPMPSAVEALCAAIVVYLLQSSLRHSGAAPAAATAQKCSEVGGPARSFGTTSVEASATRTRTTSFSWSSGIAGGSSTSTPGRCGSRAQTTCGACGAEQVPHTSVAKFSGMRPPQHETWMQFGLGLDTVPDLRGDRAGAQAGAQQDERVEHHHDLPGAELYHPSQEEGREGEEEGDGTSRTPSIPATSSMVPTLTLPLRSTTPAPPQVMGIATPDSHSEELSDREQLNRDLWKMEVDGIEREMGAQEMQPPAVMQRCHLCRQGCLHLMFNPPESRYMWRCSGGLQGCQMSWPQYGEMELALGIKLCLRCQQEALDTVMHFNRVAYRCPGCGDLTLQSEWNEVFKEGGYNPQMTHQRPPG